MHSFIVSTSSSSMRSTFRLLLREIRLIPACRGFSTQQSNQFLLGQCPLTSTSCYSRPLSSKLLILNGSQCRSIHLSRPCTEQSQRNDEKKPRSWPFHFSMSEEQKAAKKEKIEAAKLEEAPKGIFGKVKYYLKRYWYIAVPAHAVSCSAWFALLYALVHSGVDVPALLETLHMPDLLIEKVKSVPPSAGVAVVALLLYKVAIVFRYITTLGIIQATFWTLRRMGKLRTAREVEYKVRSDYETMKTSWGRRPTKYRGLGVRAYTRRKSEEYKAAQLKKAEEQKKTKE